jgi:hypothetical protein
VSHVTIDTQAHDLVVRDLDFHTSRLDAGLEALAAAGVTPSGVS